MLEHEQKTGDVQYGPQDPREQTLDSRLQPYLENLAWANFLEVTRNQREENARQLRRSDLENTEQAQGLWEKAERIIAERGKEEIIPGLGRKPTRVFNDVYDFLEKKGCKTERDPTRRVCEVDIETPHGLVKIRLAESTITIKATTVIRQPIFNIALGHQEAFSLINDHHQQEPKVYDYTGGNGASMTDLGLIDQMLSTIEDQLPVLRNLDKLRTEKTVSPKPGRRLASKVLQVFGRKQ